jgi:rubrerythrin
MIRPTGSPKAYTCRGCGTSVPYPSTFKKCPVCGIKWG